MKVKDIINLIDEESVLVLELDEETEQETDIKEDKSIIVSDMVKLIDFLNERDKNETVKVITMVGQNLPIFATFKRNVETMIRIVKRNEILSNKPVISFQVLKNGELEIYIK